MQKSNRHDYQTKEYWDKRVRGSKNDLNAMIFRDPRFREYEEKTIKYLQEWRNAKVLDVACGYGRFAPLFSEYKGVDFSEEMIKLARERNPGLLFEEADIYHFEPAEKYDLIFEVNSLKSLGMHPERFLFTFGKYATQAVACLEADEFIIYNKY